MQLYLTPKRIFSIKRIIKLETKPKIIIIEALSLELNKHINVTTYLFKEIRCNTCEINLDYISPIMVLIFNKMHPNNLSNLNNYNYFQY